MNNLIHELLCETLELEKSKENSARKERWVRHNNRASGGKILTNLHLWKTADHPVWHEIIPDDAIKSRDPEERFVERQLRHKLFKYKEIDDYDVLLSSIWVAPIMADNEPIFGLSPQMDVPKNETGSKKFLSVIETAADLEKLHKPQHTIDQKNTADKIGRIREICGSLVPVKTLPPLIGTSPFENVVQFRGMDKVIYDFYDNPDLIHSMMDFFTTCIVEDTQRLEKLYGIDPESTWDFRVHYDRMEEPGASCSLKNCWAYLSAQSAGIVSPEMFAEFIQPYHERIAAIFGKVYYHGCENLTQKASIIGRLPNLRRFHISPWSDVDRILDELGGRFVYETHVHPSNHLFLYDQEKIKKDIRELALKCMDRGVTADINLSDIETIHGDSSRIKMWSKLAKETVERLS